MKRTLALFVLTFVCGVVPASASVLYGRVVEVHDGRTVTVENTGRLIKVALKGTDAPEKDQPYGDAARQHLASLVLNRQVSIEYTGLGPDAVLIGRILCDDRDVGLQMIRDGVAWFDRSYETNLGAPVSRLYAASERAARDERRGLWRGAQPTPPWEWRRARAFKSNRVRNAPASAPKKSVTTNDAARGATPGSGSTLARPAKAGDVQWPIFSPSSGQFSVRMPEGGLRFSKEIQLPDGQPVNVDFYGVKHLKIGYAAVWASGFYCGNFCKEAVSAIFDRTVEVLNANTAADSLPCEFYQLKDASMNGYVGRRYKVRGCYLKGGMRLYFTIEGKRLTMVAVAVLSEIPDDPEIGRFLESFVLK
ncbi:MAG TPA: thermonuclease family protein [Pyrinomonadaceae bacterium]|nr:thermonuclease family protein [Pyrinomonadaceae bacterium]